jgi:probable HAF family extracellular repeat protein
MRTRTIIVSVTAILLAAGTTQAGSILYSAVDIGSLGGSGGTYGAAINNAGTVVGGSYLPNGNEVAFSYSNGAMTALGTLGGLSSTASAINNAGTIVGGSYLPNGNVVPFSYSNGTMTGLDVGALQGYTSANGINDAGVIVGSGYVNPNTYSQPYDGFIYDDGAYTIISNSGGTVGAQGINSAGTVVGGYALNYGNYFWDTFTYTDYTFASNNNGTFTSVPPYGGGWVSYGLAINDLGTAVGYYSDPNTNQGRYAFSYSNGTVTSLGTLPGGGSSWATAINNEGVIVGGSTYAGSGGNSDAFIYSSGAMTDLNSELLQELSTTLEYATAINDVGQIVAIGTNGDTYLLSPASSAAAPEPGSAPLLALGGLCLLSCRRMRR